MRTKTIEKVVKHSLVYGYAMTQPFLLHVNVQSQIEDQLLSEAEALSYGENSEIVRHLQHKLTKLGYYEDSLDGAYGLLTESAVKGFQSSHQIEITGQVDQETMKGLLFAEKKTKIDPIKNIIQLIDFGEKSENVRKVQEVLLNNGYYKGNIDGIYGPLTENAIQQLKDEGLIETEVNKEHILPSTPSEDRTTAKSSSVKSASNVTTKESKTNKKQQVRNVEVKNDATNIIQEAKNHLDTPYVWGGTSPNGFDCSGFIQYVYEEEDITIPRTVREIWNFASPVSSPSIGDLVFFETYQAGPSHMGIYLGNGNFIHAGSSHGVTISNMNDNEYWQTKYLGAKRI